MRGRGWRPQRRWTRLGLIAAGVLVLAGVVWVVITGLLALRDARRAEALLATVQQQLQDGMAPSSQDITQLAALTTATHDHTTGPAWWTLAQVPVIGSPARQVREVAAASAAIGGHALPDLLRVRTLLDPDQLRVAANRIDLPRITAAQPDLRRADAVLAAADGQVQGSGGSWLAPVDTRLDEVGLRVHQLAREVHSLDLAVRVLPSLAGQDGPQRYVVGLQNEAELRGTGGIPGTFAILVADHGRLSLTHFRSDAGMTAAGSTPGVAPTDVDFGAQWNDVYGGGQPTRLFVNSNISPDFTQAARIWAAMWEKVSGEHVDGAIALDPTVLSYLLAATGPVTAGSTPVTSDNVVALTGQDAYVRYPDQTQRRAFLITVTKAVEQKVLSGAGRAQDLVRAFARAAGGNRVQVWTADRSAEAVLQQTAVSGTLAPPGDAMAGMAITNLSGTKLDYYLHRSLQVSRLGCGATRQLRVVMTVTNDAPTRGLPAYVRTRQDSLARYGRTGSNRMWVDYLTNRGTTVESATLDGAPTGVRTLAVDGHDVLRFDTVLEPGQTRTITLNLHAPAGSSPLRVLRQPGVHPLALSVVNQCP